MKKTLFWSTFAILLFATAAVAQEQGAAATAPQAHVGLPQDWSFQHIVHHGPIAGEPANAQFHEPRAIYSAIRRNRLQMQMTAMRPKGFGGLKPAAKPAMKRDWSFTLGTTAGVADGMSPAKYSFDINATPDCTNDYVIYGVNAAGSSTQPTLVGFNNLYAGGGGTAKTIATAPTGATWLLGTATITTTSAHGFAVGQSVTVAGVGNAAYNGTQTITAVPTTTTFQYAHAAVIGPSGGGTATAVSGLCGTNPTVRWAYNTATASGVVRTSPVLSLDGKNVAFVESSASGSVFHVLTLGTTPGSDGSYSGGYSTVTPTTSTTVGTAGAMTSLSYSSNNNTRSSPWIDYGTNSAYVGDDAGNLYHITCVLVSGCTPTLAWTKNVGTAAALSSPVFDQTSQAVFVGASDGKVYKVAPVTSCPSSCTPASMTIGNGTANGGIADAVLLDSTFQTIFAFSGANASGNSTVIETGTGVGSAKAFGTALGTSPGMSGTTGPQHAPTFNNLYYNNTTATVTPTGSLFTCGPGNGSGQNFFFTTSFTNAGNPTPLSASNPPIMGTTSNLNLAGNAATQCSPVTEIFDGTNDRLFMGQYTSQANKCGTLTTGCVLSVDVTSNTPSNFASLSEVGGTSGIVVDNVSPSSQASSIYFSTLGQQACGTGGTGFCAVKLTQAGLQ